MPTRRALSCASVLVVTGLVASALPASAAADRGPASEPRAVGRVAPRQAPEQVTSLLVRYRPGVRVGADQQAAGAGSVRTARLRRASAVGGGVTRVQLDRPLSPADAARAARELAADPRVLSATPGFRVRAASASAPDDPALPDQWPLVGEGGVRPTRAWQRTRGNGVVVAVLDTGITKHPELDGQWVAGYDMISVGEDAGDGGGRDADPHDPGDSDGFSPSTWHGTHVSGTIVAAADNREGVAGLAPRAKVQPVRVLGPNGGDGGDVLAGMYWAAGMPVDGLPVNRTPARVLNLSLGGAGECPDEVQRAVDAVVARGVTVVVAAGNEGEDVTHHFPGNCARVVTVGATGPAARPASYSNSGAGVDVLAPGGDMTVDAADGVLSTYNTGDTGPSGPGYAYLDGTSMATPHVSAAAALLLSDQPQLTPAQVEARLEATARPVVCAPGTCGAGLVDVGALLPAPTVIGQRHLDWRGTDLLGDPVSREHAVTGGALRSYDRADIYRNDATGKAYRVWGAVLRKYRGLGGAAGRLGLPVSEEYRVAGATAWAQNFTRGRVYWSSTTGGRAVEGAVLRKYLAEGGPDGWLGLPTSDETAVRGGRASAFVNGRVYWGSGLGAHPVRGAILSRYLQLGGPDSRLGLPTSDEYAVSDGRRSDFQHGRIRWSSVTRTTTVTYS